MRQNELSLAADSLLSQAARDPSAPHYREHAFRRKLNNSNRKAQKLPLPAGAKEANYLLKEEWAEVIEDARLTPRQLTVLALRLQGQTFEQIGLAGGHTKQGAQNIFFQAAKKLVRAWMDYPYRGLNEVYREEVSRGVRRT